MGGTIGGRTASEMPGLDIAEQRSWDNFLEAALRVYGTLNKLLTERHGLSLLDVRLLDILDRSETGAARMGELAGQLQSLPSRVTRQIHRLERLGLVRRQPSPHDGRGVLAGITDVGRTAIAEATFTYAEAVRQRFLVPLTRSQISSLGENCRRISSALQSDGVNGRVRNRRGAAPA